MNDLSSGDVVCIQESHVLRLLNSPCATFGRRRAGNLAVVLCKVRRAPTFFDDYIYVLVDGQLLELWLGTGGTRVPEALVRVR